MDYNLGFVFQSGDNFFHLWRILIHHDRLSTVLSALHQIGDSKKKEWKRNYQIRSSKMLTLIVLCLLSKEGSNELGPPERHETLKLSNMGFPTIFGTWRSTCLVTTTSILMKALFLHFKSNNKKPHTTESSRDE